MGKRKTKASKQKRKGGEKQGLGVMNERDDNNTRGKRERFPLIRTLLRAEKPGDGRKRNRILSLEHAGVD